MTKSDVAKMKRAPRSEGLSDEELRRFLNAFYRWRENAQGASQQCSRSRVLFLCLLIRYAGLRLGEALAFDDREDMLLHGSCIRVRGKWAREVPMPPSAMKKLEELCDSPCLARERGRIARLDQGYVRRLFEQRAQEAGLDSPMSPSSLRRYRESELLKGGVPLPVVERYLGRQSRTSVISEDDTTLLQASFRRWERERRTGMYNTFRGRVERMEQGDFSSRFVVAAQSGQRIHARCSNRTAARFGLSEGEEVTVRVRMLSIALGEGGVDRTEDSSLMNVFIGVMRTLHIGKDEVKAMFELAGGERLSSIFSRAAFEKLAVSEGDAVALRIAPENVMLAGGE